VHEEVVKKLNVHWSLEVPPVVATLRRKLEAGMAYSSELKSKINKLGDFLDGLLVGCGTSKERGGITLLMQDTQTRLDGMNATMADHVRMVDATSSELDRYFEGTRLLKWVGDKDDSMGKMKADILMMTMGLDQLERRLEAKDSGLEVREKRIKSVAATVMELVQGVVVGTERCKEAEALVTQREKDVATRLKNYSGLVPACEGKAGLQDHCKVCFRTDHTSWDCFSTCGACQVRGSHAFGCFLALEGTTMRPSSVAKAQEVGMAEYPTPSPKDHYWRNRYGGGLGARPPRIPIASQEPTVIGAASVEDQVQEELRAATDKIGMSGLLEPLTEAEMLARVKVNIDQ
jgi:hypothetical protein